MADNEEAPRTPPDMPKDWSPDNFPTSARPVFRSVALLIAILAALCAVVYYTSTPAPEPPEKIEKKKHAVEQTDFGDRDGEGDGAGEEGEAEQ